MTSTPFVTSSLRPVSRVRYFDAMELRVAVAHDDPTMRGEIARLLRDDREVASIHNCSSAGLLRVLASKQPDIVILQLQLNTTPSVVMRNPWSSMVFLTNPQHASLLAIGRQLNVVRSFAPTQFAQALSAAKELRSGIASQFPQPPLQLLVRSVGVSRIVDVDDIEYVRAAGNYVELHLAQLRILHRDTLTAMEARLRGANFVRVHRSLLVRLSRIVEIRPLFNGDQLLTLRGGARVPMSRTYRTEVFRQIEGIGGATSIPLQR